MIHYEHNVLHVACDGCRATLKEFGDDETHVKLPSIRIPDDDLATRVREGDTTGWYCTDCLVAIKPEDGITFALHGTCGLCRARVIASENGWLTRWTEHYCPTCQIRRRQDSGSYSDLLARWKDASIKLLRAGRSLDKVAKYHEEWQAAVDALLAKEEPRTSRFTYTTGQWRPAVTSGRFRKKPLEIDAIRFLPQNNDPGDTRCGPVARWAASFDAGEDWVFAPDRIEIPTLEGVMAARAGDWIIRGVKGEFYPCKADVFDATYEPVGDSK